MKHTSTRHAPTIRFNSTDAPPRAAVSTTKSIQQTTKKKEEKTTGSWFGTVIRCGITKHEKNRHPHHRTTLEFWILSQSHCVCPAQAGSSLVCHSGKFENDHINKRILFTNEEAAVLSRTRSSTFCNKSLMTLRTEKEKLVEMLERQEAEIIMEVAEEMEDRLRAAREEKQQRAGTTLGETQC